MDVKIETKPALNKERIVAVALELLEEVGLEGLTVRLLAEKLKIKNPALYWHFKDKQALLNAMAEKLLKEHIALSKLSLTGKHWEGWLEGLAHQFRAALLSVRDGAKLVAQADLSDSVLQETLATGVEVLQKAGMDVSLALLTMVTLFDYTLGATLEGQEDPGPTVLRDNPIKNPYLLKIAQSGIHPSLFGNRAKGFEAGVRLILAGAKDYATRLQDLLDR